MPTISSSNGSYKTSGHHLNESNSSTKSVSTPLAQPERFQSDRKFDFHRYVIPTSAAMTGILTGLAAPELIDTNGISGTFKVFLMGGAAAFVSGVVNHFAIKFGCELAARGFKAAAVASLVPMFAVGVSAATVGYTGLAVGKINELAKQQHGRDLALYGEAANAHVSQLIKLKPIIDAASKDISSGLACEDREGCLSSGKSGRGTTYRIVAPFAARANEISVQSEKAEKFRSHQVRKTNKLINEYFELLNGSDLPLDERNRSLVRKSSEIKVEASALRESLPVLLFESYAGELNQGVQITGRSESTQNVNTMLHRNGRAIGSALESLRPDSSVSPAFPLDATVSDAIKWLPNLWPLAILTFSIELLIPVSLWLFAYLGTIWEIFKREHQTRLEGETNV